MKLLKESYGVVEDVNDFIYLAQHEFEYIYAVKYKEDYTEKYYSYEYFQDEESAEKYYNELNEEKYYYVSIVKYKTTIEEDTEIKYQYNDEEE